MSGSLRDGRARPRHSSSEEGVAGGTAEWSRWWRPLGRTDARAIIVLVVLPVLLFGVPALLGHPAIDADNLIQNFPLRVLAGRQIASGHLPLFNPLANSGTPLLGGMNAGALYPLTVIFAVIPPILAWIINLVAVYVTAALGMYALGRWHGQRPVAAFAGAVSFTYLGAMIGQIVHLGVVQGYSFVPWVVLALLALSRRLRGLGPDEGWRRGARVALGPTIWMAILWGLTFLTGEPRAIATIELLCGITLPVIVLMRSSYQLRTWRTRAFFVAAVGVGFAWGAVLGLVQLLPGWSFIGFSQRSKITYWFFGSGSLNVHWSALLFLPDVFGGNGVLGQPSYFQSYNLPEVTGYAGVLGLVAVAAFLSRVTWRGWRGANRDYVLYVVIGIVGLAATWGSFTPLGHLFHAIPLFGSTRLQSRNVIFVDFAVAALLGWWIDRVSCGDRRGAGLGRRARWVTSLPAAGVVGLCVAMAGWGPTLARDMGGTTVNAPLANFEGVTLTIHAAIAAGVLVAVWAVPTRRLVKVALTLLVLDVLAFLTFSATGIFGGQAPTMPSRTAAVAVLGDQGRTAMVDATGQHTSEYRALGTPNMNVFTDLPSVQGYGSLISTIYQDRTGTHTMFALYACALYRGYLGQVRLASIAIASSDLSTPVSSGMNALGSCHVPESSTTTVRYFGQLLDVTGVTLLGRHDMAAVSRGPVTVQLLSGTGRPLGAPVTESGGAVIRFAFPGGERAGGFTVRGSAGVTIGLAEVDRVGGTGLLLDTAYQQALDRSSWHLASTDGTFQVFKAARVSPADWLHDAPAGSRVTSIRTATWGDSWVTVVTPRAVLLRDSTAYLPGWRATAVNVRTGRVAELAVSRVGLIQEVTVPAGTWTVHFHYHAPYIELGLVGSGAGTVSLILVGGVWWVRARRRRDGKVLS